MGGYMLEGYLSGLEENEVRFISENHENFRIIVDEEHFFRLQHERIEKDIVEGYLFNNRNFKMFGCIYNGRSLSCKGYVYSSSNNPPDALSQFDRIMFTGKPIDVFAGGSANVMKKIDDGIDWNERLYAKEPRYWKEINTKYPAIVNGILCEVGIDYSIYYNDRWGERNIGTCTPRFYIDFKESVGTDIIPDCYLWVFDFMKFLSFRRNIKFDDIKIYKRNSDKKIEKTGIVYFRTIDRGEYTNSDLNTILTRDIGDKFGELFQYIAERRQRDTSDELFVPDNDTEYEELSHTSFLECALSFEGEYDRTQETKIETNAEFQQIKQLANDVVVDESCKLVDQEESDSLKEELLEYIKKRFESAAEELKEQQTSRKKKDKIVKYAKKLLDDLDKIDFSLEEQFNNVLKKYADILNDYKKMLAQRMKIRFEGNINLGQIFSKMRNEIGHGHPKDIEDIHAYTFQLARCMIYVMILDNTGISHDAIKRVIHKIF